jgi:hypothetical protein
MREHFECITDPRQPWKTDHNLLEILVMTICAIISDCDHWGDIEDYCRIKENWFREKLGLVLENGIASHDKAGRV